MPRLQKRSKEVRISDIDSDEDSYMEDEKLDFEEDSDEMKEDEIDEDENENENENEEEDNKDEEEEEDYDDGEDEDDKTFVRRDDEIEELEQEYKELQKKEQDLLMNLKAHKDEDILKAQAVKNQKVLWDKCLEIRFLLQKSFSSSNRLPQEPVRSSFCADDGVREAYKDLISSSEKTLDSLLVLQEALVEKNTSITQASVGNTVKSAKPVEHTECDEKWSSISQLNFRIAPFRNKSIDKWQRKTEVTTGAAVMRGKFQAFNQNISEQVAGYMRDPSRMLKQMQLRKSTVAIFGSDSNAVENTNEENSLADGDPELLDDSDFYQQLLKEFFETLPSTSEAETALYSLKRMQAKKRKIVDRRASKSRKIRYNIHEKIANFMAPERMDLPPAAPKLFENLFGLKTKSAAVN